MRGFRFRGRFSGYPQAPKPRSHTLWRGRTSHRASLMNILTRLFRRMDAKLQPLDMFWCARFFKASETPPSPSPAYCVHDRTRQELPASDTWGPAARQSFVQFRCKRRKSSKKSLALAWLSTVGMGSAAHLHPANLCTWKARFCCCGLKTFCLSAGVAWPLVFPLIQTCTFSQCLARRPGLCGSVALCGWCTLGMYVSCCMQAPRLRRSFPNRRRRTAGAFRSQARKFCGTNPRSPEKALKGLRRLRLL